RYFGVARSTFYLWRDRYREFGDEGLRSRRCGSHNHWPMAPAERDMLRNYNILRQASKVAVDRNGIIIFRAGYGSESEETWRKTFETLVSP
ncbi:MAG: helix-turn-helix domain-containing protein, partial [Dehalococcoidia bacterium]